MRPAGITLHVGLPKCASSALQEWADANRDALSAAGVDYPPVPAGQPAPKHQQLVTALQGGDLTPVEQLLAASTARRLLLSSEGLSNHLYTFRPEPLASLRALFAGRCDTVVLLTRDPGEWVDSMWRQCLLNPYRPRFGYGLDLSRQAFAQLPRIKALLDLSTLGRDLLAAFGARRLVQIDCRGDWLAEVKNALEIDLPEPVPAARRNVSIGDAEAELIRRLNGTRADEPTRGRIMALLQMLTDSRNDTLRLQAAAFASSLPAHRSELQALLAVLGRDGGEAARLAADMGAQLGALTGEVRV